MEHSFKKFEEMLITKPNSQMEGIESINHVIKNSTFNQNKLKNYKLVSDNLNREDNTSFNNKSKKFKINYEMKEENIMDEKTYKEYYSNNLQKEYLKSRKKHIENILNSKSMEKTEMKLSIIKNHLL